MSRPLHLTAGPIVPQMVRLCLPLLCANVLQQLYNIINSLVVTRYLGESAFAALGVAESVMNLFIYMITGACTGASVLIAQFFGEENYPRLRQQLYVSAVLIGGCTLGAVALGQIFLPWILGVIQTPEELTGDVSVYLRAILVGMAFTFTYNYLAATLRAVGDTRAALYFLLASLGYNLIAAWLLVAVLKLGIMGTALATVTAQMLSTGLCLLYIMRRRPFLKVGREDARMDWGLVHLTGSYAAVAALQQSSLYIGKLMIQRAVNGISLITTAPVSAFTAANRVENFIQSFGVSVGDTVSIFVAQNKGAGNERRSRQGFIRGFAAAASFGLSFSVFMHVGAGLLAGIFLKGLQETALCVDYLHVISWFYYMSFLGLAFAGWFRGSGRVNITLWGTSLQIAIRVVFTYLLVSAMGLNAVALSTGLGWSAIILFQSTVFFLERKGIWPRRSIEE